MAAEAVQARVRDAAHLLPGAFLLLGFQVCAVGAGALNHLATLGEQVAFGTSVVSVGLSIVLLSVLIRRRTSLERVGDDERALRQASALFILGMAALAGGLAGDFFVITAQLSGSPGIGGLVGTAILLAVYVPWL
jgi:hypothetical protein